MKYGLKELKSIQRDINIAYEAYNMSTDRLTRHHFKMCVVNMQQSQDYIVNILMKIQVKN